MSLQSIIESKLTQALSPLHLTVDNESHLHNVKPGSETHFKVVVVSPAFVNRSLLERQRLVNTTLAEELRGGVHALSMKTLTPEQWEAAGHQADLTSPPCLGGSKR